MFKLSTSGPNSCPQPKSLLINNMINDRRTKFGRRAFSVARPSPWSIAQRRHF